MSNFQLVLDVLMCILWVITYVLVFIGTFKYQCALISPIAQAIIVPFELAVLAFFIVTQIYSYAIIVYAMWVFVEAAIIVLIIKKKYLPSKFVFPYILFIVLVTVVLYDLIAKQGKMLFFSYFNTFIGELVWLRFVLKKNYAMKPLALASFITKFVANFLAVFVYFGSGSVFVTLLCVALPILDSIFIVVYFVKVKSLKHTN